MTKNNKNFFELRSDRRIRENVITINESGRVKLSDFVRQQIKTDKISIFISEDYECIRIDTNGDEHKLKKDGTTMAKYDIAKIDRKKVLFPMMYNNIYFNEEEDVWEGELMGPEKIVKKKKGRGTISVEAKQLEEYL